MPQEHLAEGLQVPVQERARHPAERSGIVGLMGLDDEFLEVGQCGGISLVPDAVDAVDRDGVGGLSVVRAALVAEQFILTPSDCWHPIVLSLEELSGVEVEYARVAPVWLGNILF